MLPEFPGDGHNAESWLIRPGSGNGTDRNHSLSEESDRSYLLFVCLCSGVAGSVALDFANQRYQEVRTERPMN